MFKKFLYFIGIIIISISLFSSPAANSAEAMEAGTVLAESSMVFSMDEADNLRERIEILENIEKERDTLNKLVTNQEEEILTLNNLLEIKELHINELEEMALFNSEYIRKKRRSERLDIIENVGLYVLGMSSAAAAIYIGDKIGDKMENN